MPRISLESSDKQILTADAEIFECSETLKPWIDNLSEDDTSSSGDTEAIPIPNVTGSILKMVIEWADHHHKDGRDHPATAVAAGDPNNVEPWDLEFFKVDKSILFEIMLAANYLDIKPLVDTTYKIFAKIFIDMHGEELRPLFRGTQNDLTPFGRN